jgi:CTP:phosphocholine cytidylyltransferase-like protein
LDRDYPADGRTYKTVNIYSFSQPSWQRVTRRLEQYVSAGRVNGYYEAVFAEMVAEGSLSFEAVFFDDRRWYEIDTLEDLRKAEQHLPKNEEGLISFAVGP